MKGLTHVPVSSRTIAFENSSFPGYTTEKIFEPMLEGSIPIYWGNPRVDEDVYAAGHDRYRPLRWFWCGSIGL